MIETIVPPGVAVVEAFTDTVPDPEFKAEAVSVDDAVSSRRREFATTRDCARRALAQLGIASVEIPVGPQRAPVWPPAVLGSLTHCEGFRAAAVSRPGTVGVLGIDAEPDAALPGGVLALVAGERESAWLACTGHWPVHADRLLFSIKESVYKAWFPLARRWLGFLDVEVVVDLDARTFTTHLRVAGPPHPTRAAATVVGFTGRWTHNDGLVATAVTGALSSAASGSVRSTV